MQVQLLLTEELTARRVHITEDCAAHILHLEDQSPVGTDRNEPVSGCWLVELEPGSHMLFAAFDRYVLGRPKIDQIDVRFIFDETAIVGAGHVPIGSFVMRSVIRGD